MYGYIYKIIINNEQSSKNGYFYIGQKKGEPKDSKWYYGSGIIINNYCKKHSDYSARKIRPIIAENIGLHKEILATAETLDELNELEKYYININKSDKLLNLTEGGIGHHAPPWNKGLTKNTDDRLKKSSEKMKGSNNPNYGKEPWNKGLQYSDDLKDKISKSTKQAMANLSQDKKDAMKSKVGHKVTAETKQKIRQTNLGKKRSQETCLKIKQSHEGKHWRLENGKRIYY